MRLGLSVGSRHLVCILLAVEQEALWVRSYTRAPQRQRQCLERYKASTKPESALARRYGVNQKAIAK